MERRQWRGQAIDRRLGKRGLEKRSPLIGWYLQALDQTLGDLARDPALMHRDLAEGDHGTADLLGKDFKSQVGRFASLKPVAK